MAKLCRLVFVCVFCIINFKIVSAGQLWTTTEELSLNIKPEDLRAFHKTLREDETISTSTPRPIVPDIVDCFGLGTMMEKLPFIFNMKPDNSDVVKTHFYLSSRKQPKRVQVWPGKQFGVEWLDFDPKRMTVMIVHGFMSHSNASWVTDMADAFLKWGDVNVVVVDWSGGGNTWKYWRAVANTRQVGSDITRFFKQLINATGANVKDFYFIGHSLGAHICSFASYKLGLVSRITGLDPAQPCFETVDPKEVLDDSDADYVDVIHTNGRLLHKIGFGHPAPIGHADFYPNGGMKQPGCRMKTQKLLERYLHIKTSQINQAICSHGRSYILFTESLLNSKCYFTGHHWNLTYEGVNASLSSSCNVQRASCALMGINAVGGDGMPRARGPYFVLTKEEEPFCPAGNDFHLPRPDLLRDLKEGFQIDIKNKLNKTLLRLQYDLFQMKTTTFDDGETTTNKIARNRWVNNILSGSYHKYQVTAQGDDYTTARINRIMSRSHNIHMNLKLNQARSTTQAAEKTTTARESEISSRLNDRYQATTTTMDGEETTTARMNEIQSHSHDIQARTIKLTDDEITTAKSKVILLRSHNRNQIRSTTFDDNNTAPNKINDIAPRPYNTLTYRTTALEVDYSKTTNNKMITGIHNIYEDETTTTEDKTNSTDEVNNDGETSTERINNEEESTTDKMSIGLLSSVSEIVSSTQDNDRFTTNRMKMYKKFLLQSGNGYQAKSIVSESDTTTKKNWFSWFHATG